MSERRLPIDTEIFLDHVGHFVADIATAGAALALAGFRTTPISVQQNQNSNGTVGPSGTGNITVMLDQGYLEFLFKTADTPLGKEFEEALSAYSGVHLAAFAVSDARVQSIRLDEAGFRTRPVVDLRRQVALEEGETEAAFTVARVEPGEMREGRMQYLTHRTEDAVWQPRWLRHPNGAEALLDAVIAVEDIAEASTRFARFLFHAPVSNAAGRHIALERGGVQLMDGRRFKEIFGPLPRLPFIGAYGVKVASLSAAEDLLNRNRVAATRRGGALFVPYPEPLGRGYWVFVEREGDLPWRAA
jgi:hypothetical protein